MPRSRRAKVTTLTKTPLRSTKASKAALVQDLQNQIDEYDHVWLFSVGDMRNEGLKEVRGQWRGTGRFYFGKGKVMAKALGETPETEHANGLCNLAKVRTQQLGLELMSACERPGRSLSHVSSGGRDYRVVRVMEQEGICTHGCQSHARHYPPVR